MKAVMIPAAALAVGLAGGAWAVGQDRVRDDAPAGPGRLPPAYEREHEHEDVHGHGQAADRTSAVRQRADAVANELDNIQEHLEERLVESHADQAVRRLFRQADAALAEWVHFRRSLRPETPPQEVAEHFRVLDRQVQALMQGMQASDDGVLRRSVTRVAFALEQLHAVVVIGAGRPTGDFVARQAHVLAGEAERLERAARNTVAQQDGHEAGDQPGDRELLDSLHDFTAKVEHFHETAENEEDSLHHAQDFALVDQSWHQVVELMNRNPHGTYLSRRASRVGAMHDDLSRVLGVQTGRRLIRFNVGDIGVDLRR